MDRYYAQSVDRVQSPEQREPEMLGEGCTHMEVKLLSSTPGSAIITITDFFRRHEKIESLR